MKKKVSENKHFGPTFIKVDKWSDNYRLTKFVKKHWKVFFFPWEIPVGYLSKYLGKLVIAEVGREIVVGEGPIY